MNYNLVIRTDQGLVSEKNIVKIVNILFLKFYKVMP
jgi:hypothetical protein